MKFISARALVLLLVVISLILGGLLISEYLEQSDEHPELPALRQENIKLKRETEAILSLVRIDESLLFESDWERVSRQLSEEVDGAPDVLRVPIDRRLKYIAEALDDQRNENEQIGRKDQLIRNQRIKVEELEFTLDSISTLYNTRVESLDAVVETLRATVKSKEAELKKQNKVKVISFPGAKGAVVHYMGEVVDAKANGGGIGIWTTGSVYRGEWKDNLRHGKGTFEWADGERYEGDYLEGRREGDGTYYWPSGERYEGQWLSDRRTGQGTLFDLDGNVRYEGAWKDDKPLTK